MSQLTPSDGWALVTGAGSGLGQALAVELCGKGFTTIGYGRRVEALEETAAKAGERFVPVPIDISDGAAVAASVHTLCAKHGPVALLINNAAIYPPADFLSDTADAFMQAVKVNLGGMVHVSHAILQNMAQSGRGRILNVSTFADIAPLPGASAYSVSKGAGRILTRALIADLQDRFPAIVLSDWMPGMLNTGMGVPDGLDPAEAARWGVALALNADPSLTGTVFEMDREVLPPRGLKGRIKDVLTSRRRAPRRL